MDRNEQFIELYNRLDNLLREYYHLSERSFSVIKRYEDELKKSSLWKNRERGMALESIRTVRNTLVHEPKIKNQGTRDFSVFFYFGGRANLKERSHNR